MLNMFKTYLMSDTNLRVDESRGSLLLSCKCACHKEWTYVEKINKCGGQKKYLLLCPWSQHILPSPCIMPQPLTVTETTLSMWPGVHHHLMLLWFRTLVQCSSMTPYRRGASVSYAEQVSLNIEGEKVMAHYKHLVQWYQGSPLISNLRPGWGVGGAPLKSHYKSIFHIPDSPMFQGVKSSMYISAIFKLWDIRVAQAPRWQPLTLALTAFISF